MLKYLGKLVDSIFGGLGVGVGLYVYFWVFHQVDISAVLSSILEAHSAR